VNLTEIARELDVAHILDGSIQAQGNRLQVIAELINVNDSSILGSWKRTYDNKLADVLTIQDDFSQFIAEKLKIRFDIGKFGNAEAIKHANPEAYDYYLKGMNFITSRYESTYDEKDFQAALSMFQRALDINPDYAQAYAQKKQ